MAQGDTFAVVGKDSVSGGANVEVNVRPASGVQVTLKDIRVGSDESTLEVAALYNEFDGAGKLDTGGEGLIVPITTAATGEHTSPVTIDNDVGVTFRQNNTGCSSQSATHAATGVQHA